MLFNERVYRLCRKIPVGKVSTYKLIAEALGTKAYRAVGQALNKNPYAPHVPCHRVVAASGHLQGFAHGLNAKEKLLEKEGLVIQNNKVTDFKKYIFKF